MTGTQARTSDADPFVRQISWLVDHAGGKDALVRATGQKVSARTLDNWVRGDYPRAAVTGAVRDLDTWAREQGIGYPDAAGAPRLIDSCGPSAGPAVVEDEAPATRTPGRGRLLAGAAALVVVTAVVSVLATLAVTGPGTPPASAAAPTAPSADLPALPTAGDGTLYAEQTGSLGSNTFTDPRTLAGVNLQIPAGTDVEVVCRYYSPVIPSVTPDGFWYLLAGDDEWAGRWAPANTFWNGDVPGQQPYTHNTDLAVPVCS